MKTSVQIMLLVVVGAVATGYAFYLEIRRSAKSDRLLEWLKTERRADWDTLSRADRFFTVRAVEILRRGPLSRDAEFHARYRLTTHGTRFAIAMGVAGTVIALLALGTTLLNWSW